MPSLCEWWPDEDKPAEGWVEGYAAKGCPNKATMSVGRIPNWHLCDQCAALPRFKDLLRRVRFREGVAP